MVGGIVDLDEEGVTIGHCDLKTLGDLDPPGFEQCLPLVETFLILKGGLEAQAGHGPHSLHLMILRTIGGLHPSGEFDRVTRVQSKERYPDIVGHTVTTSKLGF